MYWHQFCFVQIYEGTDCQYRVSDLPADAEFWVRASLTFEGEEGAWTQPVAASMNNSAKSSPEASCRLEKAAVAPVTDKRPRKRVFLKEEQKKKAILMAAFLMSVALAVIVARAWTMWFSPAAFITNQSRLWRAPQRATFFFSWLNWLYMNIA